MSNGNSDSVRILLDMDGVISDFIGGLIKLFGLPGDYLQATFGDAIVPWSLDEIFPGRSKRDIMSLCDEEFWSSLEPYPWATELVKGCIDLVGPKNVMFCSCPGHYDQRMFYPTVVGKIRWLGKVFPDYDCDICFSCQKHILATPNSILVDDSPLQCDLFSRYGGCGILFPQLWNERRPIYLSGRQLDYVLSEISSCVDPRLSKTWV